MLSGFDETKFFLGKLCNYEHEWENSGQSLRLLRNRACKVCSKISQDKTRSSTAYKQRKIEYQREWRKNNPTPESYRLKAAERQRKNYQANREEILAQQKLYASNPKVAERIRVKAAKWAKDNPERCKAQKKSWCESEKGKLLKKSYKNKYRAKKTENHNVRYTEDQIQQVCNCFENKCAYCGKKDKLQMDHAVAVSFGGPDVLGNLLPSCKSCNSGKRDKSLDSWYKKTTFLYSITMEENSAVFRLEDL